MHMNIEHIWTGTRAQTFERGEIIRGAIISITAIERTCAFQWMRLWQRKKLQPSGKARQSDNDCLINGKMVHIFQQEKKSIKNHLQLFSLKLNFNSFHTMEHKLASMRTIEYIFSDRRGEEKKTHTHTMLGDIMAEMAAHVHKNRWTLNSYLHSHANGMPSIELMEPNAFSQFVIFNLSAAGIASFSLILSPLAVLYILFFSIKRI